MSVMTFWFKIALGRSGFTVSSTMPVLACPECPYDKVRSELVSQSFLQHLVAHRIDSEGHGGSCANWIVPKPGGRTGPGGLAREGQGQGIGLDRVPAWLAGGRPLAMQPAMLQRPKPM